MIKGIINKLYNTNNLTQNEIQFILDDIDDKNLDLLFYYANKTKARYYDNKVFLRGIIEFSNYCKNNCKYCGLRHDNNCLERYRLCINEILDCCEIGYKLGIRTFVLQSGEDMQYTDEYICQIISTIKEIYDDVAITLSIGERGYNSFKRFFDAGATRYLLRQETVDKELYQYHHYNLSPDNRLECLSNLKNIGYQTGSGFIVDLPKQNNRIIAKDLAYLNKIQPHMIGIGPFIPHSKTPLANYPNGSIDKTLLCTALARLLVPATLMPVTTAFSVLAGKDGWQIGLLAGANVIMPNLTLNKYRCNYQIYERKNQAIDKVNDESINDINNIHRSIQKSGHELDTGIGDNYLWLRQMKTI